MPAIIIAGMKHIAVGVALVMSAAA